jgi:hypothetical protein
MAEAVIEFRAHAPSTPTAYIELEQLKSTLELTGQTYADRDLQLAINAASRGVDQATGRRFYLDTDANQIRYYTPESYHSTPVDDISTLTSVLVDRMGDGVYEETWTNGVEFVLDPLNAPADFRPYERICVRVFSSLSFPYGVEKSVKVTAQFGWTAVPEDVKTATSILAAKLVRRVREAPFGIVGAGTDQGDAMRIASSDPDVRSLLAPYVRTTPFI